MKNITLIGVAGGSGSGKTTLVNRIQKELGPENITIIHQDNYYLGPHCRPDIPRDPLNFDHPKAIEFSLLENHLSQLKEGQTIEVPLYDFRVRSRKMETLLLSPKPIVILEGILILSHPPIVSILNHSLFLECDTATRLKRRLARDTKSRGNSPTEVLARFEKYVAPMHDRFVKPSKANANFVFNSNQLKEAEQALLKLCRDHYA